MPDAPEAEGPTDNKRKAPRKMASKVMAEPVAEELSAQEAPADEPGDELESLLGLSKVRACTAA